MSLNVINSQIILSGGILFEYSKLFFLTATYFNIVLTNYKADNCLGIIESVLFASLVAKIGVGERCDAGDICVDDNSRCSGARCQCIDTHFLKNTQCGESDYYIPKLVKYGANSRCRTLVKKHTTPYS